MKSTLTREFFIPKNAREIKAPDSSAIAYLVAPEVAGGKFIAKGFSGKRAKPDFYYSFATEARARDHIVQHAAGVKRTEDYRRERQAARTVGKALTPLDVWNKIRNGANGVTSPEAAVCLRAVLASTFPGVKFSVRSDSSLNVSWTDGPATKAVEAIAKQYAFEGFDGMVDCRYQIRNWLSRDGRMSLAHSPNHAGGNSESDSIGDPHAPDAVLVTHGPDFVFCSRTLSDGTKLELARKICARYNHPMPAEISDLRAFLNTRIEGTGPDFTCGWNDLNNLVHRASHGILPL